MAINAQIGVKFNCFLIELIRASSSKLYEGRSCAASFIAHNLTIISSMQRVKTDRLKSSSGDPGPRDARYSGPKTAAPALIAATFGEITRDPKFPRFSVTPDNDTE
ncbi:unnamed protein product, partial [Iphiclides podalirius]